MGAATLELAPGLYRDRTTGGIIDPSTGLILRGTERQNLYCPLGDVHPWRWRPANDADPHWFDPGWRSVRFIETFCRHTKDPWRGRAFILQPFQMGLTLQVFGTVDHDGFRVFRTGYVEWGRKSGKSELAAAYVCKFMFADGVEGGEIYGAAHDQDQAGQVLAVVADMVELQPEFLKRAKVIRSKFRIIHRKTGTFYWAIPSNDKDAEGFNATLVVGDEIHVWPDRELWDVLTTSQGTREQPFAFAITTPGEDPKHSLAGQLRDYSLKVARGLVDDPTWISDVRNTPQKIEPKKGRKIITVDWKDERYWVLANPGLGTRADISKGAAFRDIAEMRAKATQAEHTPALLPSFRRRYLAQWVKMEARLIPMAAWNACDEQRPLGDLVGEWAYAGLDLASTTDLAALVLTITDPDDSRAVDVIPFFFMPEDTLHERALEDQVPYDQWAETRWDLAVPFDDWATALGHPDVGDPERGELWNVWDKRWRLIQATPGDVIDYSWIRSTADDLARVFNLTEVGFDRYGATQLVQELEDAGLTVTPIAQTIVALAPATKDFLKRVRQKKIRHGNHPVLTWMAENAVARTDSNENLKPDKSKSNGRIDGIVSLIMALDCAIRSDTGPSVYEERGVDAV